MLLLSLSLNVPLLCCAVAVQCGAVVLHCSAAAAAGLSSVTIPVAISPLPPRAVEGGDGGDVDNTQAMTIVVVVLTMFEPWQL